MPHLWAGLCVGVGVAHAAARIAGVHAQRLAHKLLHVGCIRLHALQRQCGSVQAPAPNVGVDVSVQCLHTHADEEQRAPFHACSEKMLVRDKQHAAAPRSLQQVMYHGCFLCMQQACFAANIQLSRRRSPCSLTVHTPGTSHLSTHTGPRCCTW